MLGNGSKTALDVLPIQFELLAPGVETSERDMDVGMFRVEMRHRDPVERCAEVGFHAVHHVSRQSLQVETLAELR
jgi:hypothetical protein